MSVLASHLARASSTKEKQRRCRFGRAQALRGADSRSENIKISLCQQETTWSLTQSARANFSTDNSALFLPNCCPDEIRQRARCLHWSRAVLLTVGSSVTPTLRHERAWFPSFEDGDEGLEQCPCLRRAA